MKQKTASEEHDQSQKPVKGPGSQLRKARERKGLEQAKVAAQLHLSQEIIQALEWDDYDKLPAAVFVQGYLRKYARLMGMDEDATILAYQELQPEAEQKPLPRNQPDEVARELHDENRLIGYGVWGVLLLLAVVIFFWWQSRSSDSDEVSLPFTEEQETVIERDFSTPQGDSPDLSGEAPFPPIREAVVEPSPAPTPVETPPVRAEQEAPPPAAEVVQPTREPVPVPEVEAPVTPVTPTVEQQPAAPAVEEVPQAIPPGLVVFEFSGPCWVEVRDAGGRARLVGVMRQGTRRNLDAALGPFRVVIGDIHAVRLSVNGEAYDLRRHSRGKVARFTLDPSRR